MSDSELHFAVGIDDWLKKIRIGFYSQPTDMISSVIFLSKKQTLQLIQHLNQQIRDYDLKFENPPPVRGGKDRLN